MAPKSLANKGFTGPINVWNNGDIFRLIKFPSVTAHFKTEINTDCYLQKASELPDPTCQHHISGNL